MYLVCWSKTQERGDKSCLEARLRHHPKNRLQVPLSPILRLYIYKNPCVVNASESSDNHGVYACQSAASTCRHQLLPFLPRLLICDDVLVSARSMRDWVRRFRTGSLLLAHDLGGRLLGALHLGAAHVASLFLQAPERVSTAPRGGGGVHAGE